jgi:hypothetical protein
MPAAGYKLFVTGDVLTAAQVNDYLMLQTVMVFANSAARTSALSGVLAEGLVSYLKDTDVVEIYTGAAWVSLDDPNAIQNSIVDAKGDLITATADNTPSRLAVGANNTVLTADSSTATGLKWAAAAAGGSLTFLNRTTFSAVSSQSVNSVFSSTYTNYQVIINGYSSALADMKFNYRLSGTDATANSYRSALATYDDLGTYAFIGGTATYLKLGKIVDSSTQRSVWNMIVAEPTANNRKGLSFTGWNGQTKIYWGGGDYIGSDSSAYDGFTLSCSTGTMTGSVAVYGWKES